MNIRVTFALNRSMACFLTTSIFCAPHMSPGLAALLAVVTLAAGIFYSFKDPQ